VPMAVIRSLLIIRISTLTKAFSSSTISSCRRGTMMSGVIILFSMGEK
jgi:hypothetical protein